MRRTLFIFSLLHNRVFKGTWIFHSFRSIKYFDSYNVAILVVIENDAWFILVAFLDKLVTEDDA